MPRDTTPTTAEAELGDAGATAIRELDEDALRLWKVNAPKGVGGQVAAYLVNGSVMLCHQRASGKFSVFKLVSIASLKLDSAE